MCIREINVNEKMCIEEGDDDKNVDEDKRRIIWMENEKNNVDEYVWTKDMSVDEI